MRTTIAILAAAGSVLAGPAFAQEHGAMHGEPSTASSTANMLPEACRAIGAEASAQQPMPDMAEMQDMDEAHQAFSEGMMAMHPAMMAGLKAEDVDVAFVCGMIPHHQGAIDMARVELEYGDDPRAKEMARKIIEAQEQEIAEMTAWLEEHAK